MGGKERQSVYRKMHRGTRVIRKEHKSGRGSSPHDSCRHHSSLLGRERHFKTLSFSLSLFLSLSVSLSLSLTYTHTYIHTPKDHHMFNCWTSYNHWGLSYTPRRTKLKAGGILVYVPATWFKYSKELKI